MFFESTPVDRFEELGGLDAEIARLQRVVRFRLQDEQLAARYKLKDKRGILLEGPLGNGKTKLARGTVFDSASSTIATGRRACGLACPIRAPGAAPPARNCCSAARRRGPVANLDAASDCDRPRFAVCLQALDIHYHELGGLYDRLHATGRMRDVVLSAGDVERATREPPPGGRAAARGAFIRSVAGENGWFADWQYLWHEPSGRCLDLRDPFAAAGSVVHLPIPPDEEDDDGPTDVLELLMQRATA